MTFVSLGEKITSRKEHNLSDRNKQSLKILISSKHFILSQPDVYKNWLFTLYKLALPCSVIFAVFSIGGDAESLSTVHKGPISGIFFRSSGLEAIAEKRPRDQTDFKTRGLSAIYRIIGNTARY